MTAAPFPVTAVITTYRRAAQARAAIASALAQTYRPLEIIVVEDGSDSDLEPWLAAEAGDRVHYLRHPTNRGLAAARNTGLAAAAGDYIAFLDDDDLWKPERIARQVALLGGQTAAARERIAVVYCAVEMRDPRRQVGRVVPPLNVGNLRASIIRHGPRTLPSSCLFRKDVLVALGGFDESLASSIDHDMWLRLACGDYEARALPEPLVISTLPGDRGAMTIDLPRRLTGVRQFLDKWQPTFGAWFGERGGQWFARRYFARVILRLAGHELLWGRPQTALRCLGAILAFRRRPLSNLWIVVRILGARLAAARSGPAL
jgi:glycosyltransferase involved in cell wall biosynthesis